MKAWEPKRWDVCAVRDGDAWVPVQIVTRIRKPSATRPARFKIWVLDPRFRHIYSCQDATAMRPLVPGEAA